MIMNKCDTCELPATIYLRETRTKCCNECYELYIDKMAKYENEQIENETEEYEDTAYLEYQAEAALLNV